MSVSRVRIAEEGPTFSRMAQGFGSAVRWGKDSRQVYEHINMCLEMGITTLDIAAAYGDGQAERLLGDALALKSSLRSKFEIVTKCGIGTWDTSLYHYDTSTAHILSSVDASLTRLRMDYVDVLLLHRPDPLLDADAVAEAFHTLKRSGKVLYFGASNFTPSQFELLASRLDFPMVTNEVEVSVMHLDAWHDGTLDLCQKLRISPLVWGPLQGGRLFTESSKRAVRVRNELNQLADVLDASIDQVALAWLLKHPAKLIPLLGAGKIEWIHNATRAESLELSREQWFRIWVASTGQRLP